MPGYDSVFDTQHSNNLLKVSTLKILYQGKLTLSILESGETVSINLPAELSLVTLTIHLCNWLNDKNLVKPRKTCFLSV